MFDTFPPSILRDKSTVQRKNTSKYDVHSTKGSAFASLPKSAQTPVTIASMYERVYLWHSKRVQMNITAVPADLHAGKGIGIRRIPKAIEQSRYHDAAFSPGRICVDPPFASSDISTSTPAPPHPHVPRERGEFGFPEEPPSHGRGAIIWLLAFSVHL